MAASAALAQMPPPPAVPQVGTERAPASATAGMTHLTLEEALNRALAVNNTVERARADVGVADANRRYLLSAVMPRVTASGAVQRNSESVSFSTGGGSAPITVLAANDWNYRVVLTQPVYAGRRELRAYSQAKLGVTTAREAELGTEDAVLLRVASNYLALLNAEARTDIERRNIAIAEQQRKQAQAFYEAGETTRVDVLRAETALKAAQRALALAQQGREDAVSRLRADLDLNTNIDAAAPQRALPALPDEATLVARAQSDRPDVALAANNLRIAELEIQKQRGFWLPTVTFEGGYISQKSAFPAPRYGYGAFKFNVPLWQSGEVEARVAGAKDRELQAKLDLDTAKTNAREDVRTATADLRSAETTLQLGREQLTAAEAEFAQVADLYRAQESTSLDVASSEATLADARRAVAEDTLNRDLAELRVWYASGGLKPALGVSAPARTAEVSSLSSFRTEETAGRGRLAAAGETPALPSNASIVAVAATENESGAVQK
jgi:outer membrane protein